MEGHGRFLSGQDHTVCIFITGICMETTIVTTQVSIIISMLWGGVLID